MVFRIEDKNASSQAMDIQPSFKLPLLSPFTACGVDLMGPYLVSEEKNRKVLYKVWASCYTCFRSKAFTFILSTGYSAEKFLRDHSRFTNTYGKPALCVVDHGSNIMAAAFRPEWQRVASASGMGGTKWLVTP